MVMSDLSMLKAVTEQVAEVAEPDGRWDSAECAVANVLRVLYENPQASTLWEPVYEAIKSAYIGQADWGDD